MELILLIPIGLQPTNGNLKTVWKVLHGLYGFYAHKTINRRYPTLFVYFCHGFIHTLDPMVQTLPIQ